MKKRTYAVVASVVAMALAGTGVAVAGGDIGDQAAPLAGGQALVLGLGQQQPGTDALFSIHAKNVVNAAGKTVANGEMTWEEGNPATLMDAKVLCVQVNGDDGLVTGVLRLPTSRAGEHVVAEIVDNDATGATDALRFSYQSNHGAVRTSVPGCWAPVFGPVPIATGFAEAIPPNPGT
jgi:hypothetical protein